MRLSSDGGSSYAAAGVALADSAALAYVSSGTYSMRVKLDSTAGVNTVAYSFTSADDLHAASTPALTVVGKEATWTLPKTGGAWLLKCLVNNDETLSSTLAIKVLNSAGSQEIAVGETLEAGAYGYTKAWNSVARAAGGSTVTPSGTGLTHIVGGVQQSTATLVVNADVHASAAIAVTKLAPGTNGYVLTTAAGAGTWAQIVNANVDAAAAIAGGKIAPAFGAQTVSGNFFNAGHATSVVQSGGADVVRVDPTYGLTFGDHGGGWTSAMLAVDGGKVRVREIAVPVGISAGSLIGAEMGNAGDSTCLTLEAAAGTDQIGGHLRILGGKGTGNGVPGRVSIHLAEAGSTGATVEDWGSTPVLDVEPNGGSPVVRAVRLAAVTGSAWNTGRTSLSVAGSGAYGLVASGSIERRVLELTGALSGDRTVTLPVTDGATWTIRNKTTGNYVLSIIGGANTFPLARGQSKDFWADGTSLFCTDPYLYHYRESLTLVGAVGTINTQIASLPANLLIRSANIFVPSAVTGGSGGVTLSLGTSSGAVDLLKLTADVVAGDLLFGEAAAELGTLLETNGSYRSASALPLWFKEIIAGSDVTVGTAQVEILGLLKGYTQ